MRTARLVLPALLVLLTLAGSAGAGERGFGLADWMKGVSPWAGHGVGSSFTEVTKTKMPQMPNMPDVPGMPKDMSTTTKTILTKILPDEFVLRIETTQMGRKTVTERREPRVRQPNPDLKAKVTAAGEGAVVIEGKSYTCKIWKVANYGDLVGDESSKDGPATQTHGPAMVWEHPDPKIGVVQFKVTMTVMGRTHETHWLTTKLSVSRTVSGHTFNCREITMSNSMAQGKTVMEAAPNFPGGSLRMTATHKAMGMETSTSTTVTEYVKKPLVTTEPPK